MVESKKSNKFDLGVEGLIYLQLLSLPLTD